MSTITEVAIFRQCVQAPEMLKIEELKIPKNQNPTPGLSEQEVLEKEALKLIHMVWSGTTKYLRQTCHIQNKPIELPGLGVFYPRLSNAARAQLTAQTLDKVDESSEIMFIVNSKFLGENNLKIGNNNDLCISSESDQMAEYDFSRVQRLNHANIAKVCESDAQTVELILKEFHAQILKLVKKNSTIRISYRIGRLEIKNGEINWKQFVEDFDSRFGKTFQGDMKSNSRYSRQ